MTTEEKLKNYILSKYRSVREFTQSIGMPYSTMTTILKKGVNNANVLTIIKICQALDISTGDLADKRAIVDQLIDRIDIDGDDIIIHWNFA